MFNIICDVAYFSLNQKVLVDWIVIYIYLKSIILQAWNKKKLNQMQKQSRKTLEVCLIYYLASFYRVV